MAKRKGSVHLPKSRLGRTLFSLIVTAVAGFLYFYVSLPAINLQDGEFYSFLILLCVIYVVCTFITSARPVDNVVRTPKEQIKAWVSFVRKSCLPVGVLMGLVVLVAITGSLVSSPIFRAADYRELLGVQTGSFTEDVAQISFEDIPTLDRNSANFLGDRQMGTLSDMVSQIEFSNDSTQINYQGRAGRAAAPRR